MGCTTRLQAASYLGLSLLMELACIAICFGPRHCRRPIGAHSNHLPWDGLCKSGHPLRMHPHAPCPDASPVVRSFLAVGAEVSGNAPKIVSTLVCRPQRAGTGCFKKSIAAFTSAAIFHSRSALNFRHPPIAPLTYRQRKTRSPIHGRRGSLEASLQLSVLSAVGNSAACCPTLGAYHP